MKNTLLTGLILFLFIIISGITFAFKVDSLYTGEVPVHSQSSEEKQKATALGLANVFVKVSGNAQILQNPRIQQRIAHASQFVQQIGYIASSDKTNPYLLQIHFDMNAINRCLRDANVPVWNTSRPIILGLIVDESQQPATILNATDTKLTSQLLKQTMNSRGMPFLLPTMDNTDATIIKPDTLTTFDNTTALPITKRYKNNVFLIGQIHKNSNLYDTQWKLIMGQDQWEWNLSGKTIDDIISLLVNNMTTTLSTKLAIVTSNNIQKTISLKIMGINKQSDFTQLIRYLSHLTPVASVGITHVDGTNILLNINLRSTEESFLQAVALEHKLFIVQDQPSPMTLQWNH